MAHPDTDTAPFTPVNQEQPSDGFSLETYEQKLHDNGVRTGRHASEIGQAPPDIEIKQATADIRRIISPAFTIESTSSYEENTSLTEMKDKYWQRAGRVGSEHGATRGFELDDYFKTSESRSYFSIRQDLLDRNPEGTLGRELLDAVDLYHKTLDLNPAHAATIVGELVSRGRSELSALATLHTDVSPEEATRLAFGEFMVSTLPNHITGILAGHGKSDELAKVISKQSFYPDFSTAEVTPLAVSKEDIRAIVEVFELQNRPYSRAELRMANDMAHLPAMQMAMLDVHERLICMSENYLSAHPERMKGDMASWSEIFVPETQPDGSIELLPNPKLMKAITNNVLPAVAGKLLERSADVDAVSMSDFEDGVKTAARTYKLLQSKIGLFRANPETGQIELGNMTTVTCPANQVFPNFLMQYLGPDYMQATELLHAR